MRFYGIAEETISVTPLAAASLFQVSPDTAKKEGGYILAVGNLQPRKNLMSLMEAFHLLKDDIRQNLVLVGKVQSADERAKLDRYIATHNLRERVSFTGYIADEALKRYYAEADVFVYPSLYEGFGIPPLEAMSAGAPVIACNNSSIPEVCGDAAYLCPSPSAEHLAQALNDVLKSDVLRRRMRERGFYRSRLFSWQDTARSTIQAYGRT